MCCKAIKWRVSAGIGDDLRLFVFGQRNNLGGGTHFAGFADALKSINGIGNRVVEVNVTGKRVEPAVHETTHNDVCIFFFPTVTEKFAKGTIIKWGIFESDLLPDRYIDYLSKSHQIWVPSVWAKNVLQAHDIDAAKIKIVHEGVEPDVYHPFLRSQPSEDGVFRFLMCGKNEARKGLRELIQGFELAFGNDPRVELHLKADYFWGTPEAVAKKKSELLQMIECRGLTNIKPLFGNFSTADMGVLYSNFDAMVFPSRAEGWGLPLIEAIACGLPVISTFYSGHAEFLSHIKNDFVKLDHDMRPIDCPEFLSYWGVGGSWAVVSPSEIAKKLVYMKNNHAEYRLKAMRSSIIIRREFAWRCAAEEAINLLVDLRQLRPSNIFDSDPNLNKAS